MYKRQDTTAYPEGYDITQIRSIHAWGDSATYSHQVYDLYVSCVGAPNTFTFLKSVYYAVPGHEWEYGGGSANSTQVTLTNSTGTITSGVARIQVQYTYGGGGSSEKQIAREFMVVGAPSATTAPSVDNANGATNITSQSAYLCGTASAWGNVRIYWGATDGGTNAGSWIHSVEVGPKAGGFSAQVTGLAALETYYYRCYATNRLGTAWASTAASFATGRLRGGVTSLR